MLEWSVECWRVLECRSGVGGGLVLVGKRLTPLRSSGNAIATVDDTWFDKAPVGLVLGVNARLVPAEEMVSGLHKQEINPSIKRIQNTHW